MISGFTTEAKFGCLGATCDRLKGWEHGDMNADFDGFLVAYEHGKQNRTGHWVDGRRGSARSASTGRSGRARPNPWARSHARRAIAQGNSGRQPWLSSLLTRRFFLV